MIRNMTENKLQEALSITPDIIVDSLPDSPENLLKYITRLDPPNISSNISPEIKAMMLDHLLSDKEYISIFFQIMTTTLKNKSRVESPKCHLILGQTGSGKSNLTARILKENENTVVIDSDKYKHYRLDAETIAKNHPTLYGFLTGPDAYGHRDNIYNYACENNYNILIEKAPSIKNVLGNVDIDSLIEKGYSINAHVLSVSKLNSALSIHERYEGQIEAELLTPKLTDLDRHNESFEGLNNTIRQIQDDKRINLSVYKRAKVYYELPELIFSDSKKDSKYSCPYQALLDAQQEDYQKTMAEFDNRYNLILEQMEKRNAPKEQYLQLEKVKEMYDKTRELSR